MVKVKRDDFLEALEVIKTFVRTSSDNSRLTTVGLSYDKQRLYVSFYNDTLIRYYVPADGDEPFNSDFVDWSSLYMLVKTQTDDYLTLKYESYHTPVINGVPLRIERYPSTTYFKLLKSKPKIIYTFNLESFKRYLDVVLNGYDRYNKSAQPLGAIYFEPYEDHLRLVATDGYILYTIDTPVPADSDPHLVDGNGLAHVYKAIKKIFNQVRKNATVSLGKVDGKYYIATDHIEAYVDAINREYFDYHYLFDNHSVGFKVDRKPLFDIVKFLAKMDKDIQFIVAGDTLTLRYRVVDDAYDEKTMKVTPINVDESRSVCLRAKLLYRFLKVFGGPSLYFYLPEGKDIGVVVSDGVIEGLVARLHYPGE